MSFVPAADAPLLKRGSLLHVLPMLPILRILPLFWTVYTSTQRVFILGSDP